MSLEELSKSQLLLLTILVNFVTSVATGVLTVSLLDHAPQVITRTVNQIVDHTIETVAAAAPIIAAPAPAPSNQDLVTSALSAAAQRTAYIYGAAGTSSPAIAVGTFLSKSRTVATAALESLPKDGLVVFADGSSAKASLLRSGGGVALYRFEEKASLPSAPTTALVAAGNIKLGQTVLIIASDGSAETGIVSRVDKSGVHTTLAQDIAGPAAVDLSGNVIGLASGAGAGDLLPADNIFSLLSATTTATSTSAK